jgi:hypothetical protein
MCHSSGRLCPNGSRQEIGDAVWPHKRGGGGKNLFDENGFIALDDGAASGGCFARLRGRDAYRMFPVWPCEYLPGCGQTVRP